jgi:hypothetical protein
MRFFVRLFLIIAVAGLPVILAACGIDSVMALDDPELGVELNFNTRAVVSNMSYTSENEYYFIYYKIYISGTNEIATITRDTMSTIHATLAADYDAIFPYTHSNKTDETLPIFSSSTFSARGFNSLYIANKEFISGSTLVAIDFSGTVSSDPDDTVDGKKPYIAYDETKGYLSRSNGGGRFAPLPEDRYFVNTTDLNSDANATTEINADVVKPASADITPRYAYCSIYLVKQGFNPNTLAPIYGNPTFITVFRLPEEL